MSMDVISYGVANKAATEQKQVRDTTLGSGIQGQAHSLKERIDLAEKYIQGVVKMADAVIVKDAVNIIKANAKLNAIAQSKRYKLANMVFEDFLDGTGIDAAKSKNYSLDTTLGKVVPVLTSIVGWTIKWDADKMPEDAGITMTSAKTTLNPGGTATVTTTTSWTSSNAKLSGKFGANTALTIKLRTMGQPEGFLELLSVTGGTNIGKYFRIRVNPNGSITRGTDLTLLPAGSFDATQPFELVVSNNQGVANIWLNGNQIVKDTNLSQGYGGAVSNFELQSRYYNNTFDYFYVATGLNPVDNPAAIIVSTAETADAVPSKAILATEEYMASVTTGETQVGRYFISRDDGTTWEPITPGELFYFSGKTPAGTKLRTRIEMPDKSELLNYGLTWS